MWDERFHRLADECRRMGNRLSDYMGKADIDHLRRLDTLLKLMVAPVKRAIAEREGKAVSDAKGHAILPAARAE